MCSRASARHPASTPSLPWTPLTPRWRRRKILALHDEDVRAAARSTPETKSPNGAGRRRRPEPVDPHSAKSNCQIPHRSTGRPHRRTAMSNQPASPFPADDQPKEECGVIGCLPQTETPPARLLRPLCAPTSGQEAAGIAVSDGRAVGCTRTGPGHPGLRPGTLDPLVAAWPLATPATRTTGANSERNVQPYRGRDHARSARAGPQRQPRQRRPAPREACWSGGRPQSLRDSEVWPHAGRQPTAIAGRSVWPMSCRVEGAFSW